MDDVEKKISLVFQFLAQQEPSFSQHLKNINCKLDSKKQQNCIVEFIPKSANVSTFRQAELLARYLKAESDYISRIYRKMFNTHILVIETDEKLAALSSKWPKSIEMQTVVEDMET